jgi:hypothetical protein
VTHSPTATIRPNGKTSDTPRPLRFVFFGESIISDWGNPAATTVRAVMRALVAAGHEALFLEERQNRPTIELLRARGSSALRAFAERYPDLHHRTYELPRGLERTVWFVRQVATADAVVVLAGAPTGVFEEAARLDARHLTRIVWSAKGDDTDTAWADLRLTPAGSEAPAGAIIRGPAVERSSTDTNDARSGVLLVAYDDGEGADAARQALAEFAPESVSAGAVAGADWPFVPEVALPDRYRQARVAVVVGASDDPFAAARLLLPVAFGCQTVVAPPSDTLGKIADTVVHVPTTAELRDRVASLLISDPPPSYVELPARYDAAVAARQLVERVRQARLVRLS